MTTCVERPATLSYVQSLEARIRALEACACQNNNNNNNQPDPSNPLTPDDLNKLKSALGGEGNGGLGLLELGSLIGALVSGLGVAASGGVDYLKEKGSELGQAINEITDNFQSQNNTNNNTQDVESEINALRGLINALTKGIEAQLLKLQNDVKSNEAFSEFLSDEIHINGTSISNLKGDIGRIDTQIERTNKQAKTTNETATKALNTATEANVRSKLQSGDIGRLDAGLSGVQQDINDNVFDNISNKEDININQQQITSLRNRLDNFERDNINQNNNTSNIDLSGINSKLNDLENELAGIKQGTNDVNNSQFLELKELIIQDIGIDKKNQSLLQQIQNNTTEINSKTTINSINQIDNAKLNNIDAKTNQTLAQLGLMSGTIITTELVTRNNGELAKQIQATTTDVGNNLQNNFNKLKDSRALSMSLDAINLAVNIHNALMLSRDLGESLIAMIESVGTAIGIKDMDGNPLNVSAYLSNSFEQLLKQTVGEENYNQLSRKFAQLNRIYQAGANMVDTVNSLIDDARNITETTLENTGKIGNALLESGVIIENSYAPMQTEFDRVGNLTTTFEKFTERIEQAETIVNAIDTIAGDVASIQENVNQFKQDKQEIIEAQQQLEKMLKEEKEEAKLDSQASVQFDILNISRLGQ